MTGLHPNCVLINELLAQAGVDGRVQLLPAAAPTAAMAAEMVGVEVGAIANSLIFTTAEDEPLLVLTSGAHRVDTAKVAALVGTARLTRSTAEFVRSATGQSIGGGRAGRASEPNPYRDRCRPSAISGNLGGWWSPALGISDHVPRIACVDGGGAG